MKLLKFFNIVEWLLTVVCVYVAYRYASFSPTHIAWTFWLGIVAFISLGFSVTDSEHIFIDTHDGRIYSKNKDKYLEHYTNNGKKGNN